MKKELLKLLRDIAKIYAVSVEFRKNLEISGYALVERNKIVVVSGTDCSWLAQVFFHELAHILDYRDHIYRKYYYVINNKKYLSRYAVRAEMHADKRAASLMKEYLPTVKYEHGYAKKKNQRWLRSYYGLD